MIDKTEYNIVKNWKSRGKPLLSCCCITYNHEKFISQAIDGMLIQETNFPFEIILHDDASTDGTVEIIKKYAEKYPNIIRTILQKENQYSKKRNIMAIPIKEAKGQYIASLEGDDYWIDPLKLQKQVEFLENNSDYVCCYHNSMVVDDNNKVVRDTFIGGPKDYSKNELLATGTDITTHSVVFRNVIEYPDDLTGIPFGDMVRWHLMGFYGKAKYLDNVGKAAYRKHEKGVWSNLDSFSRFEKTVFTKQRIKGNLVKHQLPTDEIDNNIDRYVSRVLTEALFNGNIFRYQKILVYIIKNHDLLFRKIYRIHLLQIWHRVVRKLSSIMKNIFGTTL